MKCSQCGSDIPNGYDVCPTCRARAARFCVKCGNLLDDRENFCSRCGASRNGSFGAVQPSLSPEEIRHTRELLQGFYDLEKPMQEQRKQIFWGIGLQFVPLVNIVAGLPMIFYIMYNSKPLIDRTAALFGEAGARCLQEKVTGVRTLIIWLWVLAGIFIVSIPVVIGIVIYAAMNVAGQGDVQLWVNVFELICRGLIALWTAAFAIISFVAVVRFFKAYSAVIEHIARYRHILKSQGA